MTTKYHNSENEIRKAQKWLQNLGSKIKVNGTYTIGMATAVSAFQRKHRLEVNGELDNETWKKLKKENRWWKKIFKKKEVKVICKSQNKPGL